jgi:NAD(P)H-dependent flavin oxidoreductase YrpB (nitropropane dioxygenase family)
VWLTTSEYQLGAGGTSAMQRALLAATSSDTVRTRIYTGKPARLLRTKWTDAWAAPDAPEPLPMPLQNILVGEAHRRIAAADDPEVVSMPVGQIVGRLDHIRPVAEVMSGLLAEFDSTVQRLAAIR